MHDQDKADDPHNWSSHAACELREKARRLELAPTPCFLGEKQIAFRDLAKEAPNAIRSLTDSLPGYPEQCIYIIELDQGTAAQPVQQAFRRARLLLDLKLPRDNYEQSRCLYVGSSCSTGGRKNTLKTRLTQHLVEAPSATYAMSLSSWASDLEGGILVSAWHYPAMGRTEKEIREIILAIEDWLAKEMKPMMGQRGIRN